MPSTRHAGIASLAEFCMLLALAERPHTPSSLVIQIAKDSSSYVLLPQNSIYRLPQRHTARHWIEPIGHQYHLTELGRRNTVAASRSLERLPSLGRSRLG